MARWLHTWRHNLISSTLTSNLVSDPVTVTIDLVERPGRRRSTRLEDPEEGVLVRAAHLGRCGKQTRQESDTGSRRRRAKGVLQPLVVDQPGAELQIWGQRPEGVDRVSDLVNDLGSEQAESAKNQVT